MVIKKVILIVLGMLAAFGIPASRQFVSESGSDATVVSGVDFHAGADAGASAVVEQIPVLNVEQAKVVSVPASVAPKDAVSGSVPAVVTANIEPAEAPGTTMISETNVIPEPSVKPARTVKSETLIGVPKIVRMPKESNGFLVSEWLNVPSEVGERIKALPAPAMPKPRLDHFTLTATTPSRLSSRVSSRALLPLLPKMLTSMPADRSILLDTNASIRTSHTTFSRQIAELLPEPQFARNPVIRSFAPIQTFASSVTASVSDRVLMPNLPEAFLGKSVVRGFVLTGTTLSSLSPVVSTRQLSPLLPEPVIARPVIRSFAPVETTASNSVSPVAGRQLLPLLPEPKPIIAKPVIRSFAPIETTASNSTLRVASRQLLPPLPVPKPVIVKPVIRSFALLETMASNSASAVAQRELLPLLPVPEPVVTRPVIRSFAPVETMASNSAASVAPRQLLPLLQEPQPVVAKPVIRSFALLETTASNVTSSMVGRELRPLIPVSFMSPTLLTETRPSFVAMAVQDRKLEKLIEPRVIVKQTLSVPETVAAVEPVVKIANSELTAVTDKPSRNTDPIFIGGQSTINPLGLIPLPSEMIFSEAVVAQKSGPSASTSVVEKPVTSKAAKPETEPILITAQNGFSADMLRPMSSRPVFPPNPNSGAPIVTADSINSPVADGNYCDSSYVGPPIRFSQTVELKLDDLLNQISSRFGVNFVVGPGIGQLPLNVKAGSIPWNVLLRSQLYVSGVRSKCIDGTTIELVLNDKVGGLEQGKFASEPLQSKYIKLKYLQPGGIGNKNVAGQSNSGGGSNNGGQGNNQNTSCQQQGQVGGGQGNDQLPQRCKFEHLQNEIKKILGLDAVSQQAVPKTVISDSTDGNLRTISDIKDVNRYRQELFIKVPGRNMFFVRGTPGQLRDIDELIKRADVPPFQVVIKGLVYTANESKLKDIGVQASAILGTGDLNTLGGITNQPAPTPGSSDPEADPTPPPGSIVPGGVRSLGQGFNNPSGLGEGLFGFSTIIGTAQFSAQVRALQQNGIISLKSRPFATVLDGDTTDLTVGRQVPVIIQAVNNLGGATGSLQILQAANLLSVTPHVIDDENGNPTAVNLELQLESNEVDTAVVSQGVPSVSVRSIQSNFILNQEQTAILGGFTVDSDTRSVTKTPGIGDIPIIGELFKRRVRTSQISRLYFAISVTVIPYGGNIEPVKVPGATTDPPSITPKMKERADKAEPKQVVDPK